jgi:hypothetical protein
VAPAGSATDRRVDRAGPRRETTRRERQVEALDLSPPDLGLQGPVRLVGPRDDEQAAGPLVEPVDDPGPLGVVSTAEQVAEPVDQGRACMRRRSVDDQPGGFVDDREGAVLIDDAQLVRFQSASRR